VTCQPTRKGKSLTPGKKMPPLLALVFFYFITLIIFFVLPIHLLIGYLLGRFTQRGL
jgi:hypothetical protein